MTDKLPPNLLALFAPRPPLRYLVPCDHAPQDRRTTTVSGVGQYLTALKEYKETDQYSPTESWLQRRDRVKLERKQRQEKLLTEGIKDYKPHEDPHMRSDDAFRTLFVARLNYDTTKEDLEMEFGRFGPIERIRIVTNSFAPDNAPKKKKYRGYAFIVFEREKDMKAAYKETDGIRIRDRRVLVDVERGRTVAGWRPRRFGGGLGGRGYTKALPARPAVAGFGPPSGPGGFRPGLGGGFRGRGGFRGGFQDRGGFRGGYSGGGRSGGVGYQSNGYGPSAPEGAPSGPRGPRRDGHGGGGGGHGGRDGGRYDDRNGPRSYDDRGRGSGSNREPVGSRRDYRDRERDRDREGGYGRDEYRKRPYDGEQYDDRSKRRY